MRQQPLSTGAVVVGALHRETFPKNPAQPRAVPYPAWRVQGSNPDWLPFAPQFIQLGTRRVPPTHVGCLPQKWPAGVMAHLHTSAHPARIQRVSIWNCQKSCRRSCQRPARESNPRKTIQARSTYKADPFFALHRTCTGLKFSGCVRPP